MKQPTVFIISCGDELLFGQTVDTNAAWLADQCTRIGWRIIGQRTIGDITPDIVSAFREGAQKADVVLATGGLGPTMDDRTRYALAEAMGVGVREDPDALKEIEAVFKRFDRAMGETNRVQALMPAGAERIVNHNGTAPGIQAVLGGARIYVMPGVPREMRPMFEETVLPAMRGAEGTANGVMRRLHLAGRGESDVGAALRHLMGEKANPEVGTAVAESIITVRIYAQGETMREARDRADAAEAEIRSLLGDDIFGVDGQTLPEAVVALLLRESASLLTAESCTGGMIASLAVDVPGASDTFMEGIVSYSNEAKINRLGVDPDIIRQHGAVSRECAVAMAEGALRKSDYPRPAYALSTTGIAGPGGGTTDKPVGTVWIACACLDANGDGLTRAIRYNTVADRYGVRSRAANSALDLLRRTILRLALPAGVTESGWKCGNA